MLVVSRKEGESIILELPNGEIVKFHVSKYMGAKTIVGIEAPKNVKILREELLKEK